MRLEVGGNDHQPLRHSVSICQGRKDAREHPEAAPADEPVAERLVRPVAARCVLPLQPVADDVDDAADHPAVVHAGRAARARDSRTKPDISTADPHSITPAEAA